MIIVEAVYEKSLERIQALIGGLPGLVYIQITFVLQKCTRLDLDVTSQYITSYFYLKNSSTFSITNSGLSSAM